MLGLVVTENYKMYKKDFGEPLYKTAGKVVGGYIEHVRPVNLPEPFCLLINEEGKLIDLPINPVASAWYNSADSIVLDPIVGDVIVMADGYVNGERDIIGLTDEQCEQIINMVYEISDEEYRLVDEPKEEEQ